MAIQVKLKKQDSKKADIIKSTLKKELSGIQDLSAVTSDKLNLTTLKILIKNINGAPGSTERKKAIYILKRIINKKSMTHEAEVFLADHKKLSSLRALIYQDMKQGNKARSLWTEPSQKNRLNIAKSYCREHNYKDAINYLEKSHNSKSESFLCNNLLLSLYLISGQKKLSAYTVKLIDEKTDASEWLLKKALLNLADGNFQKTLNCLEELKLCGDPDISAIATSYNIRMYIAYCRLHLYKDKANYDDLTTAADQDMTLLYNLSGKSRLYSLFINQKKLEREMRFYDLLSSLKESTSPLDIIQNNTATFSEHRVAQFIALRAALLSRQAIKSFAILKDMTANKRLNTIEGIHTGLLLSPQFLTTTAELFIRLGQYESALDLIGFLHKSKITVKSMELYRKLLQLTGKESEFNKLNQASLNYPSSNLSALIYAILNNSVSFSKAIIALKSVKDKTSTYQYHLLRAYIFANNKRIADAMTEIKKSSLNNKEQNLIMGLISVRVNSSNAELHFRNAINIKSGFALPEFASYLIQQQRPKEALELFTENLKHSPSNRNSIFGTARLNFNTWTFSQLQKFLSPLVKSKDFATLKLLSSKALKSKLYYEALTFCELIINNYGLLPSTMRCKGIALLKIYENCPINSNLKSLEKIYTQINRMDFSKTSKELPLMFALARTLGHKEASFDSNNKMMATSPEEPRYIKQQLNLLLEMDRPKEYQSLLKNKGSYLSTIELLMAESKYLAYMKEFQQAHKVIAKISGNEPEFMKIKYEYLGNKEMSLKQVLKTYSHNAYIINRVANLLSKDKNYQAALPFYEQLHLVNKENPIYLNNLIWVKLQSDQFTKKTLIDMAQSAYKKLPHQQILNTYIAVLQQTDNKSLCITELSARKNLNLSDTLLLAKLHEDENTEQTKYLLKKALISSRFQWNNNNLSKKQVLQWLSNIN
jgi:hypothetical protein